MLVIPVSHVGMPSITGPHCVFAQSSALTGLSSVTRTSVATMNTSTVMETNLATMDVKALGSIVFSFHGLRVNFSTANYRRAASYFEH